MSEISNAIKQICSEKGLSYDAVLVTIEAALAAAYRKDFGNRMQNIKVEFDPETAHIKAYDVKTVVLDLTEEELKAEEEARAKMAERAEEAREGKPKRKSREEEKPVELEVKPAGGAEVPGAETGEEARKFNPKTEIQLKDALMLKKDAQLGEEIRMPLEVPGEFGRMAAQTAKQVIIQKLREAERDMVYGEFKDKEKEVVSGVIQRREGRVVLIDLGKAIGILPAEEQIYGENYRPGQRIKIYVREVKLGPRGAEIILSRTSEEILRKVFYLEIPEIANGLIEIKAVAREAGSRSKVAVATDAENVDPIGSCVGQRGSRIQTIISELGGEKVDIIEFDSAPEKFIANALSPAKIVSIALNTEEKRATVSVNADQFSLAIGKSGQNVRLAAHLTGWKIDIEESKKAKEESASPADGEGEEELDGEKAESAKPAGGADGEANSKAEEAEMPEEKPEAEVSVDEKKEKKTKKKPAKKKKAAEAKEAEAETEE
ncbi:MAG: transcription termination factor NusA [Patescibacteria group bacterium]|jgi:N utilization substance protein A